MHFDIVEADVEVISGEIYPDRWISSNLRLYLATLRQPPMFHITLWNPDFSSVFHENEVSVASGGRTQSIKGIGMGRILDITVDMTGSMDQMVEIHVKQYLTGSDRDPRERAMTIVEMGWLDVVATVDDASQEPQEVEDASG